MANDEAIVRIVLQEGGGVGFTQPVIAQGPPQPGTSQSPPAQQQRPAPPPTPPAAPTVDVRSVESYQSIARAVALARRDADAFTKSVESVQGQLFKLRHGVDPKVIADIFLKGGAAAGDLIERLKQINELVGRGAIGQAERLQLVRAEIARSASGAASQVTPTQTPTGGEPEWIKHLIEGIEGANRHVLIEGQSGSGKSLLTRHVAFERMRRGEEVHVVDPHTPEQWKGAAQVFTRESAGTDAAKFLRDTLRDREKQRVEAKARGEEVDFKPLTVVFSDFARLLKDAPKLGDELRTLLTEARKFNIAVLADTTALTGAETGVKGIQNIRRNFAQSVRLSAPTATDPVRKAEVGGQTFATPVLPEYKDRFDPSIIREATPAPPPVPDFDPAAEARRRREAERRSAQVSASYRDQFGDDGTDQMSKMVAVANRFRGVVGGFAGTMIGAGLDLVSAFHRAQVDVRARRREAQLLSEAGQASSASAASGAAPASTAAAGAGPIGLAVVAVIALGAAVRAVTGELTRMSERFSDYSAAIATATAQAEIRQTVGDLRRAQELSPVLSRFTNAQSQLQQRYEDAKVSFMQLVGPAITETLNAANMAVSILTGVMKGINAIIDLIANVPVISDILKLLSDAWEYAKTRFGIGSEEFMSGDPLRVILDGLFDAPTSPGV